MKKEIYSSAWDSITMSDECFGGILDSIEEVPVITKRPRRKVSYLAVLAAAAVFMTGGVGVAAQSGAFDWVKGFFAEDTSVTAENVSDIIGEMKDFRCESKVGAEFSPTGVIYDGRELYCMLKTDKLPVNMKKEHITYNCDITVNGKEPQEITNGAVKIHGSTDNCALDGEDNIALRTSFFTDRDESMIKSGDRITMKLRYDTGDENIEDHPEAADISFTLKESGYKALDIDYGSYSFDEMPVSREEFLFDSINITPLSIMTVGRYESCAGVNASDDMKIVLDDGSEVNAKWNAYGCGASENSNVTYERYFEKPVDPDKIVKIYLDDMCIYKKQ